MEHRSKSKPMPTHNKTETPAERFLSRKEMAARWAVSIETIKRKVRAGLLHPYYLGERAVRFKLSDIEQIEAEAAGGVQ